MKIAFISYRKQERYAIGTQSDEDETLLNFLSARGLDIERVVWNDPIVDWNRYDKAVLKSPWDYHEKFPEFNTWLDRLEALNVQLMNPYGIVRWNSDKHYLKEIAGSGFALIPALFLEKDTRPVLNDFFEAFSASKLVIKPCVSASARNTLVVAKQDVGERQQQLHDFLREESFLVQPFVEEILEGELSCVFLGNTYSHSVLKLPKAGDFRVQHFHGGTIRKFEPKAEHISAAQAYVDRYAAGCLYARVDGLLIGDRFQLMELELIEPYLYLDTDPGAYQRYYEALLRTI